MSGEISARARKLWEGLAQRRGLPLLGLLALWVAYTISGLRMPWTPIVVTDADVGGGLRKALFGAAGALAVLALLEARALSAALGVQRRLTLLGAIALGSTIFSAVPALTFKRGVLLCFAITVLITAVQGAKDPVRRMQTFLVGGLGAAAWISLGAYVALPKACSTIAERPGLAGVTSHPNTMGALMAVGLTLSWGVTPRVPRERIGIWAIRLGMALSLLLAGSMTSILFASGAFALFLLLNATAYVRGALLGLAGLGAATFVLLLLTLGFGGVMELLGKDASLTGRDVLWAAVFETGLERPFFGAGYGAFWIEGRGRELVGTWNPRQAHNAYLDLFVDLGAVGGLAVLGLIALVLWEGWQRQAGPPGSASRRAAASMVAFGLAALLVYGGGESFLLKPDKLVFFALLWVLAVFDRAGPAPALPALTPAPARRPQ